MENICWLPKSGMQTARCIKNQICSKTQMRANPSKYPSMGYHSKFLAQSTPQGCVACQVTMKMEPGVDNMARRFGQSQMTSIQGAGGWSWTDQDIAEANQKALACCSPSLCFNDLACEVGVLTIEPAA